MTLLHNNHEINPTKNTEYWIYVMTDKMWKEYCNYTGDYISSIFNKNIKKDDIIFIYVKDRRKSGFTGIIRVCGNNMVYQKINDLKRVKKG